MKRKFLVLLSVLLIVILSAVVFAACNGSSKNNSNPSDKGESQTPETESPMFYEDMTFDYLYNLVKEAKSYTIVIKEIRYDAAADSDTAIWSETATASVDNVSKISYVETVNETSGETYSTKEYKYVEGETQYSISLKNYTSVENSAPIKNPDGEFALYSATKGVYASPAEYPLSVFGNESFSAYNEYTFLEDNLFFNYIFPQLFLENSKITAMPMEGSNAELIIENGSFGVLYHILENSKVVSDYSLVITDIDNSSIASVPSEVKDYQSQAIEK